ncbi:MAG: hypothetical protein QG660_197 [Pseudomonadota bacterium]|nr:hypothetical protein [Pseudomonadota bacterium]
MRRLSEAAQTELVRLNEEHGGCLAPSVVVECARNEASALHGLFDWDDTEAARLWRLEQARGVLRLCVTVIKEDTPPVRMFVSLTPDRKQVGGGYRSIYTVLDDAELRQQMLDDAMAEMRMFRRKYEALRALGPLWDAIDRIEAELTTSATGEQPAA